MELFIVLERNKKSWQQAAAVGSLLGLKKQNGMNFTNEILKLDKSWDISQIMLTNIHQDNLYTYRPLPGAHCP